MLHNQDLSRRFIDSTAQRRLEVVVRNPTLSLRQHHAGILDISLGYNITIVIMSHTCVEGYYLAQRSGTGDIPCSSSTLPLKHTFKVTPTA